MLNNSDTTCQGLRITVGSGRHALLESVRDFKGTRQITGMAGLRERDRDGGSVV